MPDVELVHVHQLAWLGSILTQTVRGGSRYALVYSCACGREMRVACPSLGLLQVCLAWGEHVGQVWGRR